MKIAVISDIHGNKEALLSVLDDIKNEGINKIFCLGDIAMGGYDPVFTIEKLFELKDLMGEDFKIIQGNTDKLIVDYSDELFFKMYKTNPLMATALKLDSVEIPKNLKNKLADLKEKEETVVNGVKIELVHGSPRKQNENIFPDTPLDVVEEAVKFSFAEVIFAGHTHIPAGFSLNSGKTLVNAGSVGRSMLPDRMAIYAIMCFNPDGSYGFEHKKVKYDNEKVACIIEKRNFEYAKEFAKLYL